MKIIDGDALKERILDNTDGVFISPEVEAFLAIIDAMQPLELVCTKCGAKADVTPRPNDAEAKEKIFAMLISCQISTYTCTYAPEEAVVSISNILECLKGLTMYRAKKALKALREESLVVYKSQGCPAVVSHGECPELLYDAAPPINSYALSKKAYDTEEWKKAYKDWEKSMEDWANGFKEEDDETI